MFRFAPFGAVLPSIVVLVNERLVLPVEAGGAAGRAGGVVRDRGVHELHRDGLLKGWKAIAPPFRSAVLPDSVLPVTVIVPPP